MARRGRSFSRGKRKGFKSFKGSKHRKSMKRNARYGQRGGVRL